MSMELDKLDEKLDEKLVEIKSTMSQIFTSQVDRIHQTSSRHDKLICALVARMDDLDRQCMEGSHNDVHFRGNRPSEKHHIKIDFPKFFGSDLEAWLFSAEEYFKFHDVAEGGKI